MASFRENLKRPRYLAESCAVAVLAALVVAFGQIITAPSPVPLPAPVVEPPAVEQAPLRPTDLATTKSIFGPFETIVVNADTPTPDTHYPAVLLLNQDGSTQASQRSTVAFSPTNWSRGDVFGMQALSVRQGYAYFSMNGGRLYVVRLNQPFILESDPDTVSIFYGAQGSIWNVSVQRAQFPPLLNPIR